MDGNDVYLLWANNRSYFHNLTGGSLPYSYCGQWRDNTIIGQYRRGTYTLTVTDAHGCDVVGSVTINQGNEIHIYTNTFPVSCNGGSDGYATVLPQEEPEDFSITGLTALQDHRLPT